MSDNMMTRKEFITRLGGGIVGIVTASFWMAACSQSAPLKYKHWVWITTDLKTTAEEWSRQFARMRQAGITAVLPEVFDSRRAYYGSSHLPVGAEWLETILPLAKKEGLEVHAWIWIMPCNIPAIQTRHPEWYMVNGVRESALDKPAYVDYYKFLCPSREEVQEFLQQRIRELGAYSELDGIHLDYIRYTDVIIAPALQPKYQVVQDREYPEFDYCYCSVCRAKFKAISGKDPLALKNPSEDNEWRQFRYDSITRLVNDKLVPLARQAGKQITAAVFPNWEAVRQQWMVWDLDGFMPMLYHNFYNADLEWIKEQVRAQVAALKNRAPLYSGLFVPELPPNKLRRALRLSIKNGAAGVSLFHAAALDESSWEVLARVTHSRL